VTLVSGSARHAYVSLSGITFRAEH
jgi:hypothetical protein